MGKNLEKILKDADKLAEIALNDFQEAKTVANFFKRKLGATYKKTNQTIATTLFNSAVEKALEEDTPEWTRLAWEMAKGADEMASGAKQANTPIQINFNSVAPTESKLAS